MEDVQNNPSEIMVPIDQVGIKNVKFPCTIVKKEGSSQETFGKISISVNLAKEVKGTHMSRFIESLDTWCGRVDFDSMKDLLADVKTRLQSKVAYASIGFVYFLPRVSPLTKHSFTHGYECKLSGQLCHDGSYLIYYEVIVPVMTVCPCSKAISDEGAHSQRADIHIKALSTHAELFEDLIDIAEISGSSPVYSLLKREDEKYVTETAFNHPMFVEDVVRHVASSLEKKENIEWFNVHVESFESIHMHNAFSYISSRKEK